MSLSESDRQIVTKLLDQLQTPVRLVFFTQTIDCEMCLPVRQTLDELVALSDKLTVEELNVVLDKERAAAYGIDRAPALALETAAVTEDSIRQGLQNSTEQRPDHDTRIRFIGAPVGYEFSSLLEAILIASTRDSGLTENSRHLIASLAQPIHIQVFVTPT